MDTGMFHELEGHFVTHIRSQKEQVNPQTKVDSCVLPYIIIQ
jgi:hypothetical protein